MFLGEYHDKVPGCRAESAPMNVVNECMIDGLLSNSQDCVLRLTVFQIQTQIIVLCYTDAT